MSQVRILISNLKKQWRIPYDKLKTVKKNQMKTQKLNFTYLNNSKVVNNILKGVLGIFAVATFASCVEDGEGLEQFEAKPDGEALAQRFEDNRLNAVQEFTMDAAVGGIITGSQGTQVSFPPNAFGISGSPVTGSVTIQLVEIYDKASILLNNKSTLGQKGNGDKEALKSQGEFFIDAKQGIQELELLALAEVRIKPKLAAEFEGAMQIFRAGDDLDSEDDWVEADENDDGENDDAKIRDAQGTIGDMISYQYDLGDFGWTNLDIWYSYAGAKTEIFIDVPEGYDGDNCAVFLSYDGESNALARMDVWSSTLEMFTEHYGLIPVGQEVHIIVVTDIDGELNYAIQGTTIVDDHIEVISSLAPITQSALESLINSLP